MDRIFVIVAGKAVTSKFNINDLPGSAGRMDLVCRFIAQSLFISHGIRKNVRVYAVLKGPPDPPKSIRIEGSEVRYLAPDERNIAGMINKALKENVSSEWKKVSPGVYLSRKGLQDIIEELSDRRIYYLREDGEDVMFADIENPAFIIGDHLGVDEEDERIILEKAKNVISLGKLPYHSDQCVTILNYILDRRENDGGL